MGNSFMGFEEIGIYHYWGTWRGECDCGWMTDYCDVEKQAVDATCIHYVEAHIPTESMAALRALTAKTCQSG